MIINFNNIINDLAEKKVICYGARYGADNYQYGSLSLLEQNGIKPYKFADTYYYNANFFSYEVLSPGALLELDRLERIAVIITSGFAHEIYEFLITNKLRGEIYVLPEYTNDLQGFNIVLNNNRFKMFMNKMQKVINNLYDDVSKDIVKNIIKGRETFLPKGFVKAYKDTLKQSGKHQYFINEIFHYLKNKKNISFIDCGAFTGDTIQDAVELGIKLTNSYCFEPDQGCFLQLKKKIHQLSLDDNIITIQKGLWHKEQKLFLENRYQGGSSVTNNLTDDSIELVVLDNELHGVQVDMLKMDIEGSELNALQGAMKIIIKNNPILAISIYHKFEDLADIPFFLMEKLTDYHYLVRHHSGTKETVLYCIPNTIKVDL